MVAPAAQIPSHIDAKIFPFLVACQVAFKGDELEEFQRALSFANAWQAEEALKAKLKRMCLQKEAREIVERQLWDPSRTALHGVEEKVPALVLLLQSQRSINPETADGIFRKFPTWKGLGLIPRVAASFSPSGALEVLNCLPGPVSRDLLYESLGVAERELERKDGFSLKARQVVHLAIGSTWIDASARKALFSRFMFTAKWKEVIKAQAKLAEDYDRLEGPLARHAAIPATGARVDLQKGIFEAVWKEPDANFAELFKGAVGRIAISYGAKKPAYWREECESALQGLVDKSAEDDFAKITRACAKRTLKSFFQIAFAFAQNRGRIDLLEKLTKWADEQTPEADPETSPETREEALLPEQKSSATRARVQAVFQNPAALEKCLEIGYSRRQLFREIKAVKRQFDLPQFSQFCLQAHNLLEANKEGLKDLEKWHEDTFVPRDQKQPRTAFSEADVKTASRNSHQSRFG